MTHPDTQLTLHHARAAELQAEAESVPPRHRRPAAVASLRTRLGWTLVEVGLRLGAAPKPARAPPALAARDRALPLLQGHQGVDRALQARHRNQPQPLRQLRLRVRALGLRDEEHGRPVAPGGLRLEGDAADRADRAVGVDRPRTGDDAAAREVAAAAVAVQFVDDAEGEEQPRAGSADVGELEGDLDVLLVADSPAPPRWRCPATSSSRSVLCRSISLTLPPLG